MKIYKSTSITFCNFIMMFKMFIIDVKQFSIWITKKPFLNIFYIIL